MTTPANQPADSHACETPDTGMPGDEWTCPECRRTWWADDGPIEWRPVVACTCPRDPDDEVDPGDPLSTCPVHGWRSA